MDYVSKSIGKQIRIARTGEGYTQDELSRKVGITKHYLSHLENGRVDPSLHLLRLISDFTGAELRVILSRTGE